MAKSIHWNNGAKRGFEKQFDEDAQDVFTLALDDIAKGLEPAIDDARHGAPLPSKVRKLKWNDDNNSTWRVVYLREYEEAIYVINAYQKKKAEQDKKGHISPGDKKKGGKQ